MKEFILFDEELKLVTENLNFLEGMLASQRQFILSNWMLYQLKEKILFSQNNLVTSSPGIQRLIAKKFEYSAKEEVIENIIDRDIKYSLVNTLMNYYHCIDFLKNFIVALSLNQKEFNQIVFSEKIDNTSVNAMLIDITNKINKEYCFNGWKNKGIAICKRSIYGVNLVLFEDLIHNPLNFKFFNANSIKHYFLPTKYNFFNFKVEDYLDQGKKSFPVDFGNYDGLDIDISSMQEGLIEYNNKLVYFINEFLKGFTFNQ